MDLLDLECKEDSYDAVLVGAGVMSATLAALLHELEPSIRLLVVERLASPAMESSSGLNNAGTGHAANCELNYTPLSSNGKLDISKAISINIAFERSLEFWASLTERGKLNPDQFLHKLPHISFVSGESNINFLQHRFQKLSALDSFSSMQWTSDVSLMTEWMPLVIEGRDPKEAIAATRVERGTDVDFGALTCCYLDEITASDGVDLKLNTEVVNIHRTQNNEWELELKNLTGFYKVQAPFVFLGAGGGALRLLQLSGIPEAKNYAGFPVSGQWLICSDNSLSKRHFGKVYGKAKVGAPPMSVPHLDSRWIQGSRSLLFGPYAGYSTKFLKYGSKWDLINSLRLNNVGSSLQVGLKNLDLVKYLIGQVQQTHQDRMESLREFMPEAKDKDWKLAIAGQRVQIIKRKHKSSVLQMGTEVVCSSDGSLAALLGASPGASTAVEIMLEVLRKCWPAKMQSVSWRDRLLELFPSYGLDPKSDYEVLKKMRSRNDTLLSPMNKN